MATTIDINKLIQESISGFSKPVDQDTISNALDGLKKPAQVVQENASEEVVQSSNQVLPTDLAGVGFIGAGVAAHAYLSSKKRG
jgi:hypothetical protein